jgi:CHASE3 domain sensor protein
MALLSNLTLTRKLLVIFGAILILSTATLATIYVNLNRVMHTTGWINHTLEVLDNLNNAETAMVNQETGFAVFFSLLMRSFSNPIARARPITRQASTRRSRLLPTTRPSRIGSTI